jgi:hypothetical protein
MGFLSQLVGAVVDAVENASGNKDSEAGNAVEQQAAAAEQAAGEAADGAAEAASEAAGFLAVVVEQAKETTSGAVDEWVGGTLRDAGIPMPNKLDMQGTVNLVAAIGQLTARKTTEKLGQIVGPTPVRVGGSLVRAVAKDGPSGGFDEVQRLILDSADVDGQVRHWASRIGGAVAETGPVQAVEEILRRGHSGATTVWEALEGLAGGRDAGGKRKPKPIATLAIRAEEERERMLEELRRAVASLDRAQPGGPQTPVHVPMPRWSRTTEGRELQRLVPLVVGARRRASSLQAPSVSRHLAAATVSAVRSALLHAQLQLWLTTIARLVRICSIAGGPSRRQPASPSPGMVRSPLAVVLPRRR